MTVRCQNGHRIALRPVVGRNIPSLHCWECVLNPPEEDTMNTAEVQARLDYLREELRAERISYGELAELQSLVEYIDPSDVELLEAAGVEEFENEQR